MGVISPQMDSTVNASQKIAGAELRIHQASWQDCAYLGRMNKRLIEDEGHSNPMAEEQLAERMAGWIATNYSAYILRADGEKVGYCVSRYDGEAIYIRQLYIDRDYRRRGYGEYLVNWLHRHVWQSRKLRLEVLAWNERGRQFWKNIGFHEYCIVMERT